MVSAAEMAAQLVASAVAGGRRLAERDALRAVLTSRFSHCPGRCREAARVLHGPGSRRSRSGCADAVTAAAETVGAAIRGDLVTVESVRAAGQALSRAVLMMRSTAGHTPDVEAAYMQACRVRTAGSLILTGHGTYNVDAEIGGDLRAHGAGATLRGGTVRVHGMLVTTELGAPAGAPVRVVLEGSAGRGGSPPTSPTPAWRSPAAAARSSSRRRRSTFRSDLTKRTGWCAPRIPSAEPRGRTPDGCG